MWKSAHLYGSEKATIAAVIDRESVKTLADRAHHVTTIDALHSWMAIDFSCFIPHEAFLSGQAVEHAGGFTIKQRWTGNLCNDYLLSISHKGMDIRSPIFAKLIQTGAPQFFDAQHSTCYVPAKWLEAFTRAGNTNLLGMVHYSGEPFERVASAVCLYNVSRSVAAKRIELQQLLMPIMGRVLINLDRAKQSALVTGEANISYKSLTASEKTVSDLLIMGKTNKEIGKALGKSDETVKSQVSEILRKLGVSKRGEVATRLLTQTQAPL